MSTRIAHSLLLVALISSFALGGSTGKITGVVKDKKTGEPIIGANVRLDGTSLGSTTDIEGKYFMINIPPREYDVVVTLVGYTSSKVTGVRVQGDLTTTIDVEISETVLQVGQEVVVVAERPLVQKDLTATTAIVSGNDIASLPVSEIGAVVNLQAGFVAGSLRGGRSGEVAYFIDGVPVTDAYDGAQVVEVNKSLVQELQVISGAFNAEYGQAMSGIVNISTKEGNEKYSGGIGLYGGDYATADKTLFPGPGFKPTNVRNIEANLSGPLLSNDLTFFVNGRAIYFNGYLNGYRRFNPSNISYTDSAGVFHLSRDVSGMGDSSVVPMNWSKRNYGQGKLTWRITPLIKLTTNYIYDYSIAKAYDRAYFYNPDGIGNNYNTSNTVIAQLNHSLSNSTFYTLGGSYFIKDFKYYLYEDIHDPRYVHPKLFQSNDSYSALTGGTDLARFHRETTTALFKFDLTSQVSETHMFKVGAEYRNHHLTYENIQLQPIQAQSDINLATASPFIQTQVLDVSSTSHDVYDHRPTEFSGYIQDKMEFKDIIVNLGVRFDYFQPDGVVLADPTDPSIFNPIKPNNRFHDVNGNGVQDPGETDRTYEERAAYWYNRASAKSAVSPRLGVSFPITARGIVHFSYGYFFQVPRFELLYENPFFKVSQGSGNQGIIGNADLKPEQTINGELGVQQQLTEDLSIDVTAYLRDIRNLAGTRGEELLVFGTATRYSRYVNSDFGFVKGIVLTMDKRISSGVSARLDYTFQVAKGSASDPQEARNAIAGGARPEVQLTPLGWDQRHTLNVSVNYSGKHWGVSTIGSYGSGTPYTPRNTQDISAILTNSEIKPNYFNIDLRSFYEADISSVRVVFFARVFNLLDTRNEVNVFNDTGRAGFTTDEATARASNPHEYVNTLDEFFRIPRFYSEPRRIEFGVNLEFGS
ncbi:MAG: TonB-dependent receptor [Ignavibacteriae bacterium]|nr:MAG: TonB-dependent receptor [Ignavibacteriota bacterium]